jgi:hypothetical protein
MIEEGYRDGLAWSVSYRVPVTAACNAYMERIMSRPAYSAGVTANTLSTG